MQEKKASLAGGVARTNALKELQEDTRPDTDAILAKHSLAPTSRESMKRITMIVDGDFHKRLKMHAIHNDITLEDIYRTALNEYLEKYEK